MKRDEAPQMIVIQDTREQLPWAFDALTVVKKLDCGDYSVCGLVQEFAIKRKSQDDLLGVIGHGRDRFERELERAAATLKAFYLVAETSWEALEAGAYRSKGSPSAVIGSLLSWQNRYPNLKSLMLLE